MLRLGLLTALITAVVAGCGGDDSAQPPTSAADSGRLDAAGATAPRPGGCPRTAGGRSAKGVAISLGRGPAYPVLGMQQAPPAPGGVAELSDDEHKQGVYFHKTLWAISRRAHSDVIIRASDYHGARPVSFFDGRRRLRALRLPGPAAPGVTPRRRRCFGDPVATSSTSPAASSTNGSSSKPISTESQGHVASSRSRACSRDVRLSRQADARAAGRARGRGCRAGRRRAARRPAAARHRAQRGLRRGRSCRCSRARARRGR